MITQPTERDTKLMLRGNPGVAERVDREEREAKDYARARMFLRFAAQSVLDARNAMGSFDAYTNAAQARLTAETAALSLAYAIDILKSMEK